MPGTAEVRTTEATHTGSSNTRRSTSEQCCTVPTASWAMSMRNASSSSYSRRKSCHRTNSMDSFAAASRISAVILLVVLLSDSISAAGKAPEDCLLSIKSLFLRRIMQHSDEKCRAAHQILEAQGKTSGYGCDYLQEKKCCKPSDCPAGHTCACADKCGVRTCHLDPSLLMERQCPRLLPPPYGSLIATGQPGRVRITCQRGYLLAGPSELHCHKATHRWSHNVSLCRESLCSTPRLPPKAHFKKGTEIKSSYARGEVIRVSCDDGYLTKGRNNAVRKTRKIKCKRNSKWQNLKSMKCTATGSTAAPKCCPVPPAPENGGRHFGNSFCHGDTIHFYCKSCYRLVGPAVHNCSSPDSYTAPNVRCEPLTCSQPALPRGFKVLDSQPSAGYGCGKVLTATCSEREGGLRETIICNTTGSWRGLDSLRSYMCITPPGPRDLSVLSTTATSVALQWRPPTMYPSEVSWYIVEYLEIGGSRSQDFVPVSPSNGTVVRTIIGGLTPDSQYHFTVRANYKSVYSSERVGWKRVDTISTTSLAPTNLQVRAEHSDKTRPAVVRVTWQAPASIAVSVNSYTVQYSTSSKVVRPYHSQNTVTVTGTSLQIVDLQPFTQYTVSVTAVTAQGDSIAVQQPFTLKSPRLRPRTPAPPALRINGTRLIGTLLPSPDVFPFVWRYSVRATCDESDSVNGLEDGDLTGNIQCPNVDPIVLFKPLANLVENTNSRQLEFVVDLLKDTRLLAGRQYRVQTVARTKTRVSSNWSSAVYFTVDPGLRSSSSNNNSGSNVP